MHHVNFKRFVSLCLVAFIVPTVYAQTAASINYCADYPSNYPCKLNGTYATNASKGQYITCSVTAVQDSTIVMISQGINEKTGDLIPHYWNNTPPNGLTLKAGETYTTTKMYGYGGVQVESGAILIEQCNTTPS